MPPRPKATPDEILVTTIRLIAELDVSGVSVDMVAERSGVSKATIYRRWPSREALIFEALTYIDYPENSPDTGSVRSDFEVLLRGLVDFLNRDDGGNVYAAFLNAAMRDKNLAQLRGEVARKARLDYERVIERAIRRGELQPDTDVNLLIDFLIAPLVYRKISENTGTSLSDVARIIDIALAAFGSDGAQAGEG
ncbi:MAG TPA: TetR/AcrR family transcriptional regulator [Sphingomicrobium sp.]